MVSARVGQREIELWRSSDVGGCVQLHRTTINESADYGRKGGERERAADFQMHPKLSPIA